MNLKILLGVVLPLFVIIVLALLSNSNTGLEIEKTYVSSVNLNLLVVNASRYDPYNYNKGQLFLQNIKIKNNFFMPRKVTLPNVFGCLNDLETNTKLYVTLQYNYYDRASNYDPYYIGAPLTLGYYDDSDGVEIEANGEKTLSIYATPIYYYSTIYGNYLNYDELILIEKDGQKYYDCSQLTDKDLQNAVHIKIIK